MKIVGERSTIEFREEDIAWIEVPNWPSKPVGWPSDWAAVLHLKGRHDQIALDEQQYFELQAQMTAAKLRSA